MSPLVYEEHFHDHVGVRLSRRELERHLKVPHLQRDRSWKSLATEPRGWSMDELTKTHLEFHALGRQEVGGE